MRARPVVSVIITTYNRLPFLKEAVESVFNQTLADWELFIVDDGSTDGTDVYASQLKDSRVKYIRFNHRGVSPNRAAAVGYAKGEFVAFLDDDDWYYPEKLERQVRYLRENPRFGLVYSSVDYKDKDGRTIKTYPLSGSTGYFKLLYECKMQSNSILVRKECFDKLGTFRDNLRGCDDYEMWLRIARSYPIAHLPGSVAAYRSHEGNMTRDPHHRYYDFIDIYRSRLRTAKSGLERAILNRRCSTLSYLRAMTQMEKKQFKIAAEAFMNAVIHEPAIGLRLNWGRFKSAIYRFARPYLAIAYCGIKGFMPEERAK